MEHRWGERFKVALPVRVRGPSSLVGQGLVVNLSVSGAFIATKLPAALLSTVRVSFEPSHPVRHRIAQRSDWTFEGHVVRRNAAGFAVEWCEFGTDAVVALANSSREGSPLRSQTADRYPGMP
jgi:PilZ domain